MQTVLAPPSAPGGMSYSASAAGPVGRQFNPYTSNGGSIMAVAGKDFCVIAGDTRQSEGYNIQTRYKPKVFRLNDRATLATNGFSADAEALVARIKSRLELYRHAHGRSMPLHSIARMLCTILYSKRFFPYYVYNILGGLDEEGKGAVYSFDPVGSYEREFCRAAGAAQSLLQPFLDNQIMFRNQVSTADHKVPTPGTMGLPEVLRIVTDSFTSATERHIEVGDGLEMYVVRLPPQTASASARGDDCTMEGGAVAGAAAIDLSAQPYGAVEALGGEDEQQSKTTMVIRRELKKD
ncbi:putative PRE7-20S proteasome subunit [Tilletiaria anomala UBC 951]|uniref:Proteasome subunit beta n=1 Tax=Tilletiaria anomala (strain ATCC 24038 / CBS 436.72 / UBC 951) TaxID=1037660 RepID=A0A066VPP4_TILAU|nr:putative PRE7-20S proteasome subunit [Tilletiaria anomala UBC 951]KDN43421.1 putative PRE7-20S proteasome subunit [Tilletiaria anomala UBC 951]